MKGCGVVLSAFLPGGPIGPGEGDKDVGPWMCCSGRKRRKWHNFGSCISLTCFT